MEFWKRNRFEFSALSSIILISFVLWGIKTAETPLSGTEMFVKGFCTAVFAINLIYSLRLVLKKRSLDL